MYFTLRTLENHRILNATFAREEFSKQYLEVVGNPQAKNKKTDLCAILMGHLCCLQIMYYILIFCTAISLGN